VAASGLADVRFMTEERLRAIMDEHRANGVSIANPHVFTLEDGAGHKRVDADQLGFKLNADPLGLLNRERCAVSGKVSGAISKSARKILSQSTLRTTEIHGGSGSAVVGGCLAL
jgi:hypothetical protein